MIGCSLLYHYDNDAAADADAHVAASLLITIIIHHTSGCWWDNVSILR